MAGGFEVETNSFDRASTGLSSLVTELSQGLDRLRAALGGHENALSRDDVSGPFAKEYVPLVERALVAIASYGTQVGYASAGLAESAEVLRTMEELNAQALAQLRAPWLPPAE